MKVSKKTERKGYWLFKQNKVKKDLETEKRLHFMVKSENEERYVIFNKKKKKFSCDCEYFSLHLKPCSHIMAAKFYMEDKQINNENEK
jgi:hypothetical protein